MHELLAYSGKSDSTLVGNVPNIEEAYYYGLTYPGIMNDFQKPITREEFCTIVVKLYEKLTGSTVTAGLSPFRDTSNPEVVKAYQLGVVKGTGEGQFSPGLNITRQEICVMLFRALGRAFPNLDRTPPREFPFADQALIAPWALEAMNVEIRNPYDKPTLPGAFNADVEWEWREDVNITYETWADLPTSQQYANALSYTLHFVYGLCRGASAYPIYDPVFDPVRGQSIPALQPGEKQMARIYLKEFLLGVFPFATKGDEVLPEDFARLCWGELGNVEFRVYTDSYKLPDPKTAAKNQGFKEESDHIYYYSYDRVGSASKFLGLTDQAYHPIFQLPGLQHSP